jgi:cobyrinic acid a,c-diamide synthase
MDAPRIMIAGERSGVGKSTITVGILLALKERGLDPQPFKSGPDFLDPMHHSLLLSRKSQNLDTWMFSQAVDGIFRRASKGAGISVIEGAMGLYDGADGDSGEGSAADLAKRLSCPVVLVVDARSTAASVGAIALGFQMYDPAVNLAGVVFNNVAGPSHLKMLKASLRDIECLGSLPKVEGMSLESRHLGLVPASERPDPQRYEVIRRTMEDHLDIDRLVEIACFAPPLDGDIAEERPSTPDRTRIGIAHDAAFNFYYQENLDMLERIGAELVPFSPLREPMPDVDGLYFGGGYPELYAEELESNVGLREAVRRASLEGMPIYAECGGMMYLCREFVDQSGKSSRMAGVFDAEVEMTSRLQALGYVKAAVVGDCVLSPPGASTRGHVFHYSRVSSTSESNFAYELNKTKGIVGSMDGFVAGQTLASYTHLHFGACLAMASNFVDACISYRDRA